MTSSKIDDVITLSFRARRGKKSGMVGVEKLVQGIKVISIRVYGFGGDSIFGACDFYRRLRTPRVMNSNPGLQTSLKVCDGLLEKKRIVVYLFPINGFFVLDHK